jgi:hypothetical protein
MSSRVFWDSAAGPELKTILGKLQERFGGDLRLLPSDPEWLTFQVFGLTEFALLQSLERERQQLFGDLLPRCQIVSQQAGKERGVSIRYLGDSAALAAAAPGFWLY